LITALDYLIGITALDYLIGLALDYLIGLALTLTHAQPHQI